MNSTYYIRSRGRISGPFDEASLSKLIRRGIIARLDEVSQDQSSWTNIDQLSTTTGQYLGSRPETGLDAASDRSSRAEINCTKYFYAHEDSTFGPVPEPLLIKLAELGKLLPDDVIWAQGTEQRFPARHSAILANAFDGLDDAGGERSGIVNTRTRVAWTAGLLVALLLLTISILVLIPKGTAASSSSGNSAAGSFMPQTANSDNNAGKDPSTNITPHLFNSNIFISDPKDENAIAAAVGFVVIGFEAILPDGTKLQRPLVTGSCFSITPSGYLLTNRHVVSQLTDLADPQIRELVRDRWQADFTPKAWVFFGPKEFDGDVTYTSSQFDLAVVKIDRTGQPFFRLAANSDVGRGIDVFAAGFPGLGSQPLSTSELRSDLESDDALSAMRDIKSQFKERDFDYTLTRGAIGRVFTDEDGDVWIQHEAVIRHGNSGGPLIQNNGVVVAINSRIQTSDEDVQTNISLEISQLRKELDENVPGIIWVSPAAH